MRIKADNTQRIETGPLQINDDWTGVFIRGDNAGAMMLDIQTLLRSLPEEFKSKNAFATHTLTRLYELLGSANEHKEQK